MVFFMFKKIYTAFEDIFCKQKSDIKIIFLHHFGQFTITLLHRVRAFLISSIFLKETTTVLKNSK